MSVVAVPTMDGAVEPNGGVVQQRDHRMGDLANHCPERGGNVAEDVVVNEGTASSVRNSRNSRGVSDFNNSANHDCGGSPAGGSRN